MRVGLLLLTEGNRQPVSFCLILLGFTQRLGSRLFPCLLGFSSWSLLTCLSLCAIIFVISCCTAFAIGLAVTIFGVCRFLVGFVAFCWFAWMRTAILAGGIAVVRSGFGLCRRCE